MRAVIQRCRAAQVQVDGQVVGRITHGLTVFLAVAPSDEESTAAKMAAKIAALRIFSDANGRFNLSLREVAGGALVISNFTLYGDARKGNRPNFMAAAAPELANQLYQRFVTLLREQGVPVETGVFAAAMSVTVENDGPVTLVLDL